MDLDLTEQQELLQSTARSYFTKECNTKFVRAMEGDEIGYSPEMWRKMAELGWLGLTIPEKYEGAGGSFQDLVILYQEMGRVLCPSPHLSTVVLCGGLINEIGSGTQKRQFLPKIANGELVGAFAAMEGGGHWYLNDIKMEAQTNESKFNLNGSKLFVQFAEQADFIIVIAKTVSNANGKRGKTAFVIDSGLKGITYTQLKTIAGDKQAEVTLKNVKISPDSILGKLHYRWPDVKTILDKGVVALCAQMIGSSEKVMEMTNDYAKSRVQFGRPIGSFQALQHYLADIVTEIAGAKTLMYEAAWTIDQGLSATKIVAMTKIFVGDTNRHVTAVGHQIMGGIAYTLESDMELYFRRAKSTQLSLGTTEYWEEIVARELPL